MRKARQRDLGVFFGGALFIKGKFKLKGNLRCRGFDGASHRLHGKLRHASLRICASGHHELQVLLQREVLLGQLDLLLFFFFVFLILNFLWLFDLVSGIRLLFTHVILLRV